MNMQSTILGEPLEFEVTDFDVSWTHESSDDVDGGKYRDVAHVTILSAKVTYKDDGDTIPASREQLIDMFGSKLVWAWEKAEAERQVSA